LLTRLISIQEHERAKMARDLHDELGQVQTAVMLASRSLINAQSLEQARERGQLVHQMAAEAMETTRRLARGLSPSVLNDFGLGRAIERMCEDFAAAGSTEVRADNGIGDARFKPDVEIAVYRVAQEAITNTARHSGAARVLVRLKRDGSRLVLEVTDDGRGFNLSSIAPPSDGGLGIPGMNERTVLLGGRFEIIPVPTGGTTVRAEIPVPPDGIGRSA
jgi:signal transduction histidine kinase